MFCSGVGSRKAHGLHRHLQHDLVALRTRPVHLFLQVLAIGRETQRHVARKRVHRLLRQFGVEPHATQHDGDLRPVRSAHRKGDHLRIDIEGLAAAAGNAGQRPGFARLRHIGDGCPLQRPAGRDEDRGFLLVLRLLACLAVEDLDFRRALVDDLFEVCLLHGLAHILGGVRRCSLQFSNRRNGGNHHGLACQRPGSEDKPGAAGQETSGKGQCSKREQAGPPHQKAVFQASLPQGFSQFVARHFQGFAGMIRTATTVAAEPLTPC